jgi:hypothetical protein
MQGESSDDNMPGLDFDSVWAIQQNDYPDLRPSVNTLNLDTTHVTDAQAGDGNEVPLTVTFDEDMTQNTGVLSVSPDVDGHLTTTPSVENKRWTDARTFKADLQFTDDNEDVTGVTLEFDGAKDAAGNTMSSAVSTTYDVDTKNPSITGASVTSSPNSGTVYTQGETVEVTVTYDEAVSVDTSSGTPTLNLGSNVGGDASYSSGSGSSELVFAYTVQASDDGSLRIGDISLNSGTMKDAAGNDASTTSSSESISATVDGVAPSGNTLSLSTTPITDAQTGDGNEVTVTVTFGEDMTKNTGDVSVSPDVDGDLTTMPSVENKHWTDARTFKADLQFTDDNEDVTGVILEVDGAKDAAGNTMSSAVSTTYDVDTKNPTVTDATISNSPINDEYAGNQQTVTVDFSETMDMGASPTVEITGVSNGPLTVTQSSFSGSTWKGTVTINDNDEEATATIDVSGAADSVGNSMDSADTSNTFEVDTREPSFASGYPTSQNPTQTSFDIAVKADEGGKAYYVVVSDDASAPSVSQVKNGENAQGSNAIDSGSHSISSDSEHVFTASSLSSGTSYDSYVVVEDSHTNTRVSETLNAQTQDSVGLSNAYISTYNGGTSPPETKVTIEFAQNVDTSSLNPSGVTFDSGSKSASSLSGGTDVSSITATFDSSLATGDSPSITVSSSNIPQITSDASTTLHTIQLDLASGENMVSVPAAAGTTSVSSLPTSVDVVWEYDNGQWTSSNNGLTDLEGGQGYIFVMDSSDTIDLNVDNTLEHVQRSSPGERQLEDGWNLVGQWQEGAQTSSRAFATADRDPATTIYEQDSAGSYGLTPLSGSVQPGESYWIFTTGQDTWTESNSWG